MATEPKPPEGYDTWLDYAVTYLDTRTLEAEWAVNDKPKCSRMGFVDAARAELAKLRKDAKSWREMKPALKTFGLKIIAGLEPFWDDDNGN